MRKETREAITTEREKRIISSGKSTSNLSSCTDLTPRLHSERLRDCSVQRRSGASGTSFSESLFSLGGCQVGKRLSREYLTPFSADANSWQLCNWSFTAVSGLIHVTFVKSQFLK